MKRILHITLIALGLTVLASCGKESGGGSSSSSTTGTSLSAPSDIALHSSSDNSLAFQWTAVSGATSYEWKLLEGSTEVKTGTTTTRNATITGLSAGTTYKFAARSVSATSSSAYSSYVEATTTGSKEEEGEKEGDKKSDLTSYYDIFEIPSVEEDGVARAFPGAEGGGMYTTGGRGGTVYHVTNLNDSGEGSLRYGVEKLSGARTIVFDVAGIIELQSKLQIKNGDLTIAGQTAPGDGVCLKNWSAVVKKGADNVIIRFMRFRPGDESGCEDDAIWGRYLDNVILDHCSMSWSIDECSSFYANENFTMQWCLLTESLNNSTHLKGTHGYGGIWGGKNASFHHNMFANHNSRTPRFDHPEIYENSSNPERRGNVDYRNCVNYNWGSGEGCYGGEGGWFNMVNNYYLPGQATKSSKYLITAYGIYSNTDYGYPYLYLSGNYIDGNTSVSSDNSTGINWKNGTSSSQDGRILSSSLEIKGKDGADAYTTTHTAAKAFDMVLNYAGASLSRDAVDKRAATDASNGTPTYASGSNGSTGGLIDSQTDVGGWPEYSATSDQLSKATDSDGDGIPDWFEEKYGLDKNDSSDGNAISFDKNGRYTNLEMYLHYLVKDIVKAQNVGGSYTKL